MTWQDNLEKGRDIVQHLLTKSPLPLDESTIRGIPNTGGIYLYSGTQDEYYYVGKSNAGLRTRNRANFNNPTDGGFLNKIMNENSALRSDTRKRESQNLIRGNVFVRWLTTDELGNIDTKWAENFAISVLRPQYNRQ